MIHIHFYRLHYLAKIFCKIYRNNHSFVDLLNIAFVFIVFFMIIFCNTLLPSDREESMSAEIGTFINPTPVIDNVTDVVVAPIIPRVSIDSNIVFTV